MNNSCKIEFISYKKIKDMLSAMGTPFERTCNAESISEFFRKYLKSVKKWTRKTDL